MRRIVLIVAVVLAVLFLAVLSLPFLINTNRFKPLLESKLSEAFGRRVTIGNLELSILSGGVTADSLAVADDPAFGGSPFLQAKSLKVGVELWPLVTSRRLNITGLTIVEPQVTLLQAPSGRWNYSSLGGTAAQTAPPPKDTSPASGIDMRAKSVRIVDGHFSMGQSASRRKPLALDHVNISITDFAASASFPFSVQAQVAGGGEIKVDGKAGPIDAADAELMPLTVSLDIAHLNLASALAGTAPDIAGTASLHAAGNSSGGRLTLDGKLKAEGLKLARNGTPARKPVEFDFAAQHDLNQHAGSLERGDIHVGQAIASITGTYVQHGESTVLNTKFAGSSMPVPELAELLPPLAIVLPNGSRLEGGTATTMLRVEGPADRLVADGSITLDHTRLANFDLGRKMSVLETLAGIKRSPNMDIETLSAHVKYSPEGIVVDGIRVMVQDVGELNGAGTVTPANVLDFKMNATVQTTRSATLSHTAIPFSIEGTAMDPVFRPEVGKMAKSEANALLQSEAAKRLKGGAGKAAAGILDGLLGGKKK
jgi:AsmA protein